MSQVSISIDEQIVLRFLNAAASENLSLASLLEKISLNLHVKQELSSIDSIDDAIELTDDATGDKKWASKKIKDSPWVDEAIERVKAIKPGENFCLRTIFAKSEWKQLPSPRVFGRIFRDAIEPKYATRKGNHEVHGIANYERNQFQG